LPQAFVDSTFLWVLPYCANKKLAHTSPQTTILGYHAILSIRQDRNYLLVYGTTKITFYIGKI